MFLEISALMMIVVLLRILFLEISALMMRVVFVRVLVLSKISALMGGVIFLMAVMFLKISTLMRRNIFLMPIMFLKISFLIFRRVIVFPKLPILLRRMIPQSLNTHIVAFVLDKSGNWMPGLMITSFMVILKLLFSHLSFVKISIGFEFLLATHGDREWMRLIVVRLCMGVHGGCFVRFGVQNFMDVLL